jgi:glycosyltransferase involved in cell wall biosynthesis
MADIPQPRLNGPLVTVVMIFLNGAEFMDEAVQSVIAQTYRDWELVLVDDGSTDASSHIARAYADQDPARIRYVEHAGHENRGMSASRNRGVQEGRGQYIAFLDSDDVYLPDKLEAQVAILERETRAAMVYGPSSHWYTWSPAMAGRSDQPRRLGVPPDQVVAPPELVTRFLQREAQTPGTCSVLIRRAVVESVGGFEAEFRGLYEDQVFFYKVAAAWPIYVESTSRDLFRQHPTSHTRVLRKAGTWSDGRPEASQERLLHWLAAYFDATGVTDRNLRRTLAGQLWPYRSPIHRRLAATVHAARRAPGQLARRLALRARGRV